MTFPQQCTRIPVFHFLCNVWCTPSQGFCTSCTLCQLHSSLWIVHSQTLDFLKSFSQSSLPFLSYLKLHSEHPPYHPPSTLCPLLLYFSQRICVLVSLSSYPPLWWFVISMITVIFCCFFHMCLKNNTFWYCWVGELFHKVKCYSCIPCLCKRSWLTVSS